MHRLSQRPDLRRQLTPVAPCELARPPASEHAPLQTARRDLEPALLHGLAGVGLPNAVAAAAS
eukprot:10946103-Alexandrium_andersonii.AAC.1